MTGRDDSRFDVVVGADPDALEMELVLTAEELATGCYVAGNAPQKQTAMLHDWVVQWAAAGAGGCYLAPRGSGPLDLLARLPADRLADVVWIDYNRTPLADVLDVPRIERVALDSREGPAEHVDTNALETEPIAARSSDWLSAAHEYRAIRTGRSRFRPHSVPSGRPPRTKISSVPRERERAVLSDTGPLMGRP